MSDADPGPHPPPSADIASGRLPIRSVSGPWVRLHAAGRSALYWGPRRERMRFDAPDDAYGVLYAANDDFGAFVEVFGHRTGVRAVDVTEVRSRDLSWLHATRPLRLVELTGSGLTRLGADGRIFAGDYGPARAWARALHDHPDQPDGLLYAARHDETRLCVAIFDRARIALTEEWRGNLGDPLLAARIAELLDHYGFGLL